MLPNFFWDDFSAIRFLEFPHQSTGKCCPIFSNNIFRPFDLLDIRHQNAENAAQFFQEDLLTIRFLRFRHLNRRKCCATFLRVFCGHLIFWTRENAAHFFKEDFSKKIFQPFDFEIFIIQHERKCCQMFCNKSLGQFDLTFCGPTYGLTSGQNAAQFCPRELFGIICFNMRENAAQFSPKKTLGQFDVWHFVDKNRTKCCPILS